MTFYKTTALSMVSLLALAGCPSDDDADGTGSGTDTDPTTDSDTTPTDTMPTDTTPTDTMPTDTDPSGVDSSSGTDDTSSGAEAMIRVIHGSPGSPAVDVYVAGTDTAVISGLAYGEASEYLPVEAGDYAFDVRAAGASADEDPAFTTDTLTLEADAKVSALAAGLLGGGDDDGFRVIPLVEGFEDPGAGNAAVRVVHAGSDAPAVDIDVGDDGTSELEGVGRFAESGAAGVALPSDTALQIGIIAGGEKVTAFTTPELPEGGELFVIATGLLSDLPRVDSGFALLAVGPDGAIGLVKQNPRVYAVHGSPDAPNVDICAGEALLLGDVPYGAMGGIQVPPGEYTLDIYGAGDGCDGTPVGSPMTPALAAGEQYLALATGELMPEGEDPAFSLEYYVEAFDTATDPAQAAVKIIHGASAPAVNIGTLTAADDDVIEAENALVTGLAWPDETTDEIVLDEGNYFVGVGAASDNQPRFDVLASFTVPAAAGLRAWVLASGALAPDSDTEDPFALYAIVTGAGPWTIVGPIAPNAQ